MRAIKQLGHNALLVENDDGGRLVALGRGLGFLTKPGEEVQTEAVEQWFALTSSMSAERLFALLPDLPLDMIGLASEITELAMTRLGSAVAPSVAIPLADHLNQAVKGRFDSAEHPLRWEVGHLYPQEFAIGIASLDIVEARTGIRLADAEAVSIALHLINALQSDEGMQTTVAMTKVIPDLLNVVATATATPIRYDSLAAARFVTHIRYLFMRLDKKVQLASLGETLARSIPQDHPEAYQLALRIQYLIESRTNQELSGDETAFLTLHVARLLEEIRH